MSERFYVSSVTGYGIGHELASEFQGLGSRFNRKPPVLWYVFDSAPPRLSKFMGVGELGFLKATHVAEELNAGGFYEEDV